MGLNQKLGNNLNKIAIIDPSSYSIPYDYFYINELSKYYIVDFYYSNTRYNYEYIEKLRLNCNVNLLEYNISPIVNSKVFGLINYFKMMKDIFFNKDKYLKIHFVWSIFELIEIPFFLLIKNKLIFTFHNDVPHSYNKKIYSPYKIINKIAKKVVFVSNFTKNKFIEHYETSNKYFLIKHGIMPIDLIDKSEISADISRELIFWGRIEGYKGIDIFDDSLDKYDIGIYGKWNKNLSDLKESLSKKENIHIVDSYLDFNELSGLLSKKAVFIMPYKDATQSGVLYTFLAYQKVFISSDVGENKDFLESNGLGQLVFNRKDEKSIEGAIEYAIEFYDDIVKKMQQIKETYEWKNVMKESIVRGLYER